MERRFERVVVSAVFLLSLASISKSSMDPAGTNTLASPSAARSGVDLNLVFMPSLSRPLLIPLVLLPAAPDEIEAVLVADDSFVVLPVSALFLAFELVVACRYECCRVKGFFLLSSTDFWLFRGSGVTSIELTKNTANIRGM
jgi:hypothetical protein